jgi:hypothetical protein
VFCKNLILKQWEKTRHAQRKRFRVNGTSTETNKKMLDKITAVVVNYLFNIYYNSQVVVPNLYRLR